MGILHSIYLRYTFYQHFSSVVGGLIKHPFTERKQPSDFNDAIEPGYYAASNDISPLNAPLQDAAWYGSLIVTKTTGGSGGNPIMQLYLGIYPRKEVRCRQQWAGSWQDWDTL